MEDLLDELDCEKLVKVLYSSKIKSQGLAKAFKEGIEGLNEIPKSEEISESQEIRNKNEAKLKYVCWSLMFNKFDEHTEVVPLLVEELRKVANELEEFYKNEEK